MQPMQHPQVQQQQQHMVQSLHVTPALTAQSGGQQLNTASAHVQLSQQQQWNAQVFQNALHATAFWRRFRSVELHVVFFLQKLMVSLIMKFCILIMVQFTDKLSISHY